MHSGYALIITITRPENIKITWSERLVRINGQRAYLSPTYGEVAVAAAARPVDRPAAGLG